MCVNFLTASFHTSNSYTYRKTGFNPYQTLTEIFANKYTATYTSDTAVTYPTSNGTVIRTKTAGTLKVRAITMDDIKRAIGLSTIIPRTDLTNTSYQNLFKVEADYWLASTHSTGGLWYVDNNGYTYNALACREYGVRPTVSLKMLVKVKNKDMMGAWNIEI